jgi:hypothetical protein
VSDARQGRTPGSVADEAVWAVALLALAIAVRLVFVARLEIPPFDPWRHLALIRNLRDGVGFTLFDGQPYLWYTPTWYSLCAIFPEWFRVEWLAGLLSALVPPAAYLFMRSQAPQAPRVAPIVAGLGLAVCGPAVAYTCHYGPEALALLLTLLALWLGAASRSVVAGLISGMLFGVGLTLRLNFVFDGFLFLPLLRRPGRAAGFAAGAALPLLATWWRNHAIIDAHPWLFTWDGLATRSADFGLLSTLVPQMHPAIAEGLRRLHEQIIPYPEWIRGPDGIAWGLLAFMICGMVGLIVSRSWAAMLAGGSAILYFSFFDRSMSAHFFRIYLVVVPTFWIGLALTADRLWRDRRSRAIGLVLLVVAVLGGSVLLVPAPMLPLEGVTPSPAFVEGDRYLVNSGFFHPESLIYRYPDKRFIGVPIDAAQLDDFLRDYPDYDRVLWHDRGIQPEVGAELFRRADLSTVAESVNPYGVRYRSATLESAPKSPGPM